MKKRMASFLLAAIMLSTLILTAAAAEPRTNEWTPSLSFDGTTANCYFSVIALGKPITATLELWRGNTCVVTWTNSATSRLIMDKTCKVNSGTIDGVAFTGIPVSGTC